MDKLCFLNSEAAANKAIEKGIGVEGLFVQVEQLSSLGTRIIISSIPPYLPHNVVLPFLNNWEC